MSEFEYPVFGEVVTIKRVELEGLDLALGTLRSSISGVQESLSEIAEMLDAWLGDDRLIGGLADPDWGTG